MEARQAHYRDNSCLEMLILQAREKWAQLHVPASEGVLQASDASSAAVKQVRLLLRWSGADMSHFI
jgi:hypothetical protein